MSVLFIGVFAEFPFRIFTKITRFSKSTSSSTLYSGCNGSGIQRSVGAVANRAECNGIPDSSRSSGCGATGGTALS